MPPAIQYPFPRTPLTLDERGAVRALLKDLEERHGLLRRRPGLAYLCEVFLTHCSPPSPRPLALEGVARFLHLVMYFADRVSPSTVEQDAATLLGCLSGRVSGQATPFATAAQELGGTLRAAWSHSGADAHAFTHLLRVNLATFVWAAQRDRAAPDAENLAAHLGFRTESICAKAYLRLWGLLVGLSPADELRFGFHFQEAEGWSARVQALANDLRSVSRDAREGTPNAVAVLARERGVSAATAEELVFELHEDALRELCASLDRARSFLRAENDAASRYLDFIGICTQGNESSMLDLSQRYDDSKSTH